MTLQGSAGPMKRHSATNRHIVGDRREKEEREKEEREREDMVMQAGRDYY